MKNLWLAMKTKFFVKHQEDLRHKDIDLPAALIELPNPTNSPPEWRSIDQEVDETYKLWTDREPDREHSNSNSIPTLPTVLSTSEKLRRLKEKTQKLSASS